MNALRAQMPVTQKWAYFDHAAVAPLPEPTSQAIATWLRTATEEGDTLWLDWAAQVSETRNQAAKLIGANTEEIALVPSTTAGINFVAEGLEWKTGDNVVTLADEFPSNLFPWMHLADRGVETRRVPTDNGRLDLDQLAAAIDHRTRVVTVSWIGYSTGYRQDIGKIAELAHAKDALFFLDAIQGLGAFPLDVNQVPIDFLAADGHKWMLGPEGAGIAYIRQKNLDRLRPIGVGWNSVVHAGDFSRTDLDLKPTAARYEGGTQNMAGMIGLGASLKLLQETGIENVAEAILHITDVACERLSALGATVVSHRNANTSGHDPRSGIIAFELPGKDPMAIRKHCLDNGIALACRAGRLRISPHGYNDLSDLDKLIEVLPKQ